MDNEQVWRRKASESINATLGRIFKTVKVGFDTVILSLGSRPSFLVEILEDPGPPDSSPRPINSKTNSSVIWNTWNNTYGAAPGHVPHNPPVVTPATVSKPAAKPPDTVAEAVRLGMTVTGVGAALLAFKAALIVPKQTAALWRREFDKSVAIGSPDVVPETKLGKAAAAMKGGGKSVGVGPVIDAVIKLGDTALSDDSDAEKAKNYGGAIGGMAGTFIGGALGSFIGPAGTVLGASIGSYFGEMAGEKVGAWLAEDSDAKVPAPAASSSTPAQPQEPVAGSAVTAPPGSAVQPDMVSLANASTSQSVQTTREIQFNPTTNIVIQGIAEVELLRRTVEDITRNQFTSLMQLSRSGQLYDDPAVFV